jgi:hypothetical protein
VFTQNVIPSLKENNFGLDEETLSAVCSLGKQIISQKPNSRFNSLPVTRKELKRKSETPVRTRSTPGKRRSVSYLSSRYQDEPEKLSQEVDAEQFERGSFVSSTQYAETTNLSKPQEIDEASSPCSDQNKIDKQLTDDPLLLEYEEPSVESPIPEADSTTAIATANDEEFVMIDSDDDLAPVVDVPDIEMIDYDEDPTSPDATPLADQYPDLADSDDEENDEQGNKPIVQQKIISFEEAMEIIKARLAEKE